MNDISLTWSALSLPVLEPLTPEKLEKLCVLTMSCLYCAVSNATASSLLGISSAISPKYTGTASGKSELEINRFKVDDFLQFLILKQIISFSLISSSQDGSVHFISGGLQRGSEVTHSVICPTIFMCYLYYFFNLLCPLSVPFAC